MNDIRTPHDATEIGLDPADWGETRAIAHRMIDESIDYLAGLRQRAPWTPMPETVRDSFKAGLPRVPQPLDAVYAELKANLMPYPMGNIHPRFWAWFMGSSNLTGALGDFLAAVQGSNLGGGNHAAAMLDGQVVDWCKDMLGFPASASGTLVSGGSMAHLLALTVARNVKAGIDVRDLGVAAMERPLRFYGSDQLHACHRKAIETLGLGHRALRRVATTDDFRIDLDALKWAIISDRAAGFTPACIIASAGTVNTGSIDELDALADLAAREGLWLHVDGCIGALLAVSGHRHLVKGIERADSVALDPHKWLHAPFEAGCVLVRDAAAHRGSFAVTPEYLEASPRGLAAADWLHEYGLQTTRGFRALKIWMALKEHGIGRFGRMIDQNIAQAAHLTRLIEAEPTLELAAPTVINIVCFRYRRPDLPAERLKPVNVEIMLRLQEQGIAVLSDTTIDGRHCLRVAIVNHRSRRSDFDALVRAVVEIGGSL